MESLRIGIIGCGVQGSLYAALLTGAPIPGLPPAKKPEHCVLTAVAARSAASLEKVPSFPGVARFDSYEALLESSICDAVVITTPHYSHPELAIAALQAGKHVLCEKPMAVQASEARRILQCAEAHPELTLALMLNQRVNPLLRQLKQIIADGELGQLRRVNWIINSWWRSDAYYGSNPWRGTWSGEGGGVLVNQAPHQLDLLLWLCGKPRSVYGKCLEGAYRNIGVENDVTMVMDFENGATGTFITCTHDPMGTDRLELDFSKGKIVAENSRTATVTQFREDEMVWNRTLSHMELMGMLQTNPDALFTRQTINAAPSYLDVYVDVFDNFADHIFRGTPLIAPGEDGLAPVQLANAAQLSGWLGQEVPFPCDEALYNRLLQEKCQAE